MSNDPNIVILAKREDPFARIPKTILEDERMSWKAKGILSYLLGKPTGWKLRVSDIVKRGEEGERSVRAGLQELLECGYAEFVRIYKKGRISEGVWKVSDSPIFLRCGFAHEENVNEQNSNVLVRTSLVRKKVSKNKGGTDYRRNHCDNLETSNFPIITPRKPLYPYPTTEEEMASTLKTHGIDYEPDYDGSFFNQMENADWKVDGKSVYDWIKCYSARLKKTQTAA